MTTWRGFVLRCAEIVRMEVGTMLKFRTRQGYIAYQCTASETTLLGGMGICDDCGKFSETGFLVPVLNHYMCPRCFEDWQNCGHYYPEDIPIEQRRAAYYESTIPMEVSEKC